MADRILEVAKVSAKGSFFLVIGNVLASFILFVNLSIVARLLGPSLYGLYTISIVIPTFVSFLVDLGVNASLTKFPASLTARGEKWRISRIVGYGIFLKTLLSIAMFSFCFVFSDFLALNVLNRQIGDYLAFASLVIPFQAVFDAISNAFVGLSRTEISAVLYIVQALVKAITSLFAVVVLTLGIYGVIAGHIIGFVVPASLGIWVLFREIKSPEVKDGKGSMYLKDGLKTIISYGFPVYLGVILQTSIVQLHTLILALLVSNADVGNFQVASNLLTVVSVLALPISTALFPAFSRLDLDREVAARFFKIAQKYLSLLIVPASMGLAVLSNDIISVIYGPAFVSAPYFLSIYSMIYLLVGLGYLTLMSFYNGIGETKVTFLMNLVGFFIFIITCPLFTWVWGVAGSIVSLILSSMGRALYGLFVGRSRFNIESDPKILRIYLVSIVSAVPAISLGIFSTWKLLNLVLGSLVFLGIYLILTPIATVVSMEELDFLKNSTQQVPIFGFLATQVVRLEKKIMQFQILFKKPKQQM